MAGVEQRCGLGATTPNQLDQRYHRVGDLLQTYSLCWLGGCDLRWWYPHCFEEGWRGHGVVVLGLLDHDDILHMDTSPHESVDRRDVYDQHEGCCGGR